MSLRKLGLGLVFLIGATIGGLALAFLVVFFKPELLVRTRTVTAAAVAASTTPPAAAPLATVASPDAPESNKSADIGIALHSFAGAVHRAAPAVVNIYTARVVTEQVQPNSFERLFGQYGPHFQQRVQRALGSGVIVDESGHIITNNHVIANATSIKVQLADGRSAEAKVVGRDPDTDLALLSVELTKLPVMSLGRSDRLQVGDEVLAIGNPLGTAANRHPRHRQRHRSETAGRGHLREFHPDRRGDQRGQLGRRADQCGRGAGRDQHRGDRQEHGRHRR